MAHDGDVKWTKEMTDFLDDLYVNTDMSNQMMANELNRKFSVGASRNAVIGKISRMRVGLKGEVPHRTRYIKKPLADVVHSIVEVPVGKISRRSRVGVEALNRRKNAWGKVPPLPTNFDATEILSPNPVALEDIDLKQCHWPLGGVRDKPPYMYCGNATVEGKSYCLHHCWLERRIK